MTMHRLGRASAYASVLTTLLATPAGCGVRPAASPTPAQVTVAVRMVVHSCAGARARQVPIRASVLLDRGGRQVRVTTGGKRGYGRVRLTPGRYTVAPRPPALRHAVVSARFDGSAVRASPGGAVIDVTGGRHRILLLVALRPLECNGRGAAG